jgi:hypothetical protein
MMVHIGKAFPFRLDVEINDDNNKNDKKFKTK